MYCSKCGAKNLEIAKFCKGCGKQIDEGQNDFSVSGYTQKEKDLCASCGKKVNGDANFCISCGNFRKKTTENIPPHMSNGRLFLYIAGAFFLFFIISQVFSGHFSTGDIIGTLIGALIVAAAVGFDLMRAWRR